MMTSGSKKYFNCHIHTKNQKKRAVCFSPEKKSQMTRLQEQKFPVKISKFKINWNSLTRHCHQPGYQYLAHNTKWQECFCSCNCSNRLHHVPGLPDKCCPRTAYHNNGQIVQPIPTQEDHNSQQNRTYQTGWNTYGPNRTNQHCSLAGLSWFQSRRANLHLQAHQSKRQPVWWEIC